MPEAPVVVIIGGGWHTPASYAKLISALQATGLEVHCPALSSVSSSRPPVADLSTDTTLIRDYVEKIIETGQTVVAVMHSYGGQVGTNALSGLGTATRVKEGKQGGVDCLLYLCAFAQSEGKSMIDKVAEFGHMNLMPIAFDFAEDNSVLSRDPKNLILGPGLSDEETDEYLRSLNLWNGKCMYDGIERSAWREIPVMYVQTTQDMTVPLDYQKDMIEKMKAANAVVNTAELATGHCPNATMPNECAEIIKKVAFGEISV
ncbi:alpha/beta-hydrolase [Myriangium duriaei CBS 260.36]|uniref:Alpha/beta-hydrolase n=1 Tax=Myriangium duriaei CBS 260.36 TaxID=1168546 RepID=A0A9P4J197_9PEZI|nr:alpha/beta-hydrolase [Myriangium duriaei CBS 260.36]